MEWRANYVTPTWVGQTQPLAVAGFKTQSPRCVALANQPLRPLGLLLSEAGFSTSAREYPAPSLRWNTPRVLISATCPVKMFHAFKPEKPCICICSSTQWFLCSRSQKLKILPRVFIFPSQLERWFWASILNITVTEWDYIHPLALLILCAKEEDIIYQSICAAWAIHSLENSCLEELLILALWKKAMSV